MTTAERIEQEWRNTRDAQAHKLCRAEKSLVSEYEVPRDDYNVEVYVFEDGSSILVHPHGIEACDP